MKTEKLKREPANHEWDTTVNEWTDKHIVTKTHHTGHIKKALFRFRKANAQQIETHCMYIAGKGNS